MPKSDYERWKKVKEKAKETKKPKEETKKINQSQASQEQRGQIL
jgi:hypothetical protein